MDILDRLLGHDAWTTRQLLLRCRGLSEEQLDRDFDIGHRTVPVNAVTTCANEPGPALSFGPPQANTD